MRFREILETTRLDELLGVKRYKTRTLMDVLDDFTRAGGEWAGGKFGTVLTHPSWSYAYKFFTDDACYLRFIRWAMRNPDPHLPRVLSRPRRIVPFYRRHKSSDEIYIVKLEKLNEWHAPSELGAMGGFAYVLEHVALAGDAYEGDTLPDKWKDLPKVHIERWLKTKDFLKRHPEFHDLARFYFTKLLHAPIDCAPDIHTGNVMQRDDGTLVFTDPFWYGETPYQLAAAARQAEMDPGDDEPDERDYVNGGQKWKKPKKRRPPPPSYNPDEEEMPF